MNNQKRNMSYGEFFLSVLLFVSLMTFLVVTAGSCAERDQKKVEVYASIG